MAFAEINGCRIHYEASGNGPPVVWLHGLMGSIERGKKMGDGIDGLAERGFRRIAYDARGHGESGYTEDESDYTWEAHARDMLGLLDHLGIERAAVGGGSMGAGTALTLARAHPERVEKLVLLALPGFGDEIETAKAVFGAFASLIESVGLAQAVELVMQLPQFAELKERDPEQYAQTRDWLSSLDPQATVAAVRGLLNGPQLSAGRLGEVRVPALIAAHPDDPIHPASSGEKAHAAIAGSQLVMGETMDHFITHRAELLDTVATFLRGGGSGK